MRLKKFSPNFARILDYIEADLSQMYGFAPHALAKEHVLTDEELVTAKKNGEFDDLVMSPNANVLLSHDSAGELFIGIHFSPEIWLSLEDADPSTTLNEGNLNAFCVVAEELSHFHLILNRAVKDLSVSSLELEWQGEVDKYILAAMNLQRHHGDPHFLPLARRLFDMARIQTHAKMRSLYEESNRLAARFCFDLARHLGDARPNAREWQEIHQHLKSVYYSSWEEKSSGFSRSWQRAS